MGLAEGLELGRIQGGETVAQVEVSKGSFDEVQRRRRGQGDGSTLTSEVDGPHRPGQHDTLFFDQITNALQQHGDHVIAARTSPGVLAEPVVHDFGDEEALGAALRRILERHAERTENFDFRFVPEHFRVEEESIHVK